MHRSKLRLSLSALAVALTIALAPGVRAEATTPAGKHIEAYYQQLLPTIRQAASLSVRERNARFGPPINSAFDLGTMTKLAVGPAWTSFSGAQQGAVRQAFARFLVANYASLRKSRIFRERGGQDLVRNVIADNADKQSKPR